MATLIDFLVLPLVLAGIVCVAGFIGFLVEEWRRRDQRRRARIEAELDRQEAELRAVILDLAQQLGNDAHQARKAMIRASFLASGRSPKRK